MEVFDEAVNCARSSAIADEGTANCGDEACRFAEIGWLDDPTDFTIVGILCNFTGTTPRIFLLAKDNNLHTCGIFGQVNGGSFLELETHDANQDTVWRFIRNGNSSNPNVLFTYDYISGPFDTGDVGAAGERKLTSDQARANHDGLKRMNSSQVWESWGNGDTIVTVLDVDDGYVGCPNDPQQFQVKQAC